MLLATGEAGELHSGYALAATLGHWSLNIVDTRMAYKEWTVQAVVESCDDYWLAHGTDWTLRLKLGRGWWCWQHVQMRGDRSTVRIEGMGVPMLER